VCGRPDDPGGAAIADRVGVVMGRDDPRQETGPGHPPGTMPGATHPLLRASGRTGRARLGSMIWTLIRTDFKVRYHGTIGGFVWALLKPVSMFVVLLTVFSLVFNPTDPHYQIKLILGLFLWEFFADGTKVGLVSLFAKGYLLTKTRVPRWIIAATSIANSLVNLLVFTAAILLYLGLTGRFPSPVRLLLFFTYEIQLFIIVLGFSLATSVLYLRYRDLTHLWDAISQAGFFVAPIVFPFTMIPEPYRLYLYLWPPTPVIRFSRQVLIEGTIPTARAHLFLLGVSLSILTFGILLFRRQAPRAAEHL
jgi:ABC-type polysaccharide/polyol phosphate export permease